MMLKYENILLEKDLLTHIAKLTLNRPERRNAINEKMLDELSSALDDVGSDDEIRVVVVSGAGDSFCAGGDLQALSGGSESGSWVSDSPDEIRRSFEKAQKVMLALQRMEKPIIGKINGVAVGAGLDLAAVCDIRIGTSKTRFMSAYVKIGLFPGFGGTWLYPRALGSLGKAAELLFTGDFLEADEAKQLGFLNKLVAEEDFEDEVMSMAQKIADGPPIAIRLSKLMLYKGLEFDLETAMKMAAAAETITLSSNDHTEGVNAFREKRKPKYKGY
jgi:enoyl-CoA hydratase/carnithine racemase